MKQSLKRLLDDLEHEQAILMSDTGLSLNPEFWSYDAWEMPLTLSPQGST